MAERIEGRMGRMMEQVESRIEGLQGQMTAAAAASAAPLSEMATETAPPNAAIDLPVIEETILADAAASAAFARDRPPILQTVLPDLPERLAALAPITIPSHDRDLAVAATLGIAVGAILVGAARLLRSS